MVLAAIAAARRISRAALAAAVQAVKALMVLRVLQTPAAVAGAVPKNAAASHMMAARAALAL